MTTAEAQTRDAQQELPVDFAPQPDRAMSPGAQRPVQQSRPISFEALREFSGASRKRDRSQYTSAARLFPSFRETLPTVDAVSFDIFDTALLRYVDHPVDVFFHLAQHPAFKAHRFAKPVSQQRIEAEGTARRMVFGILGSSEVNLLEIYQVFCDLNGISREFAEGFVATEEQVELDLCIACRPIQRLAKEAAGAGKRVLFISDTYHTADFLLRLLRNIGYTVEPTDIFASSEARKSKQSGQLFPEVLATVGIAPPRVLHFGDHPVSDYAMALSAGLNAILHSHKASREASNLLFLSNAQGKNSDDRTLSQMSIVRGIVQATGQAAEVRGHGNDFWWKFGYSSAGPLTVGFCQWLEQSLRSDGMEHACFLLRDGELLFQVYQSLFKDDPSACSASRLDSSRRAMLLPVAGFSPTFAIPSLFAGIGPRPVREYLDRLGIDADPFKQEAFNAGFTSLDERIDGRCETKRLLHFFVQQPVLRAILERGNREREVLAEYLAQEGLLTRSRVALVDLGWTGTIHKCLHVLLGKIAPATRLTGYYMATFPDAEHTIFPDLERRSYLARQGEPVDVFARIHSFLNLFESVYTSTEGSTLYFDSATSSQPGHAAAVRQASDKSPEQCSNLNAIHAGALAFAEDFKRIAAGFDFSLMPPELAAEEFFRVIEKPTADEARLLGSLVHCDNLGSSSTHVSASLRPTGNPGTLLEDFAAANWKQGVLALPTPEAAALRTLLWLNETQPAEDIQSDTPIHHDPPTSQEPDSSPNLLIHSMHEFSEIILQTLDLAGANDVVEIGTEYGGMSTVLANWLKPRNGRLRCIDPSPKPEFLNWVATEPGVAHLATTSLEALPGLAAADAWIVDGDHNWYTVSHELELIFAKTWAAGKHPLIFLHDVGWPNARRDSYYAPDLIPEEFRKPYTFNAGAVRNRTRTVPGRGFRGGTSYAYADLEGGPRNGVLTAVEDAITAQTAAGHRLAWCNVPAVFGLGIIFDTTAPWSAAVIQHLLPVHNNKLLATLERNRLDNFLRVVEMVDSFN